MEVITHSHARREYKDRLRKFNELMVSHIFAFELKEPSFKTLHDCIHADTELYHFAVGLGPVHVERYYNLIQEKMNAQSQKEKNVLMQHVQRSITQVCIKEGFSNFNDFCQTVNSFDTKYHNSGNAVHYLQQLEKSRQLEETMEKKGIAYRLYYTIRNMLIS